MVRTILCQPVSEPKVFSDDYDATASCCTPNGLILIASSSGNIHVYFASEKSNNRSIYKFQIGGVAKKIVYCSYGSYIATLESKLTEYHSGISHKGLAHQARVYLNWTTQPSDARYLIQHRAGYTRESQQPESYSGKFLVIDLPIKYSVTDIACCETNGNIALSTEAKVFLYSYQKIELPSLQENGFIVDFQLMLEIDAGFQINHVALYESHIAFASSNEIRAIQVSSERKESICQAEEMTESTDDTQLSNSPSTEAIAHCELCQSKADENFVMWNIDQGCSQGLEGLEHETIAISKRPTTSPSYNSPTYIAQKSMVKLQSVVEDSVYVDHGKTAKEVIGPKEAIIGHPLTVLNSGMPRLAGQQLVGCEMNHVTMLYRRFPNGQLTESSEIHSLQWMPIRMESSPQTRLSASRLPVLPQETTIVSLGFFFSTARKGYLYDMLNTPILLSEYDFTDDCISACLTHEMLYVITKNGLETYTTRLYAAAAKAALVASKERTGISPRDKFEVETRERTWSSLSFSSGSEADCKSQGGDSQKDFSEEDNSEIHDSEELVLTEGHYTKVAAQSRTKAIKKSNSRLSFRRRKKNQSEKRNNKSQAGYEKYHEDSSLGMEKVANLVANENKVDKSPKYENCDLIKPCPPTSIEICLIGMYSLRDFTFIGCCDRHAVLLQKVHDPKGKRGSIGKERFLPWNVYILEKVPAVEICKEIVTLIEGSESANPSVYYQLLSEAHICLRAALIADLSGDKKEGLRISIRKSAVMLGDFFSRCKPIFLNNNMVGEYYNMAGIKLGQVLTRHSKRDDEENISEKYGVGVTDYLNDEIFGENSEYVESLPEELALQVLKIYSTAAPELVSKVILKSKLKLPNPESVATILENLQSSEGKKTEYKHTNLDYVNLAILRLQLGDPNQTEQILKRIPSDQLIETISAFPEVVQEEDNLTLLGQLLRRHFPATFTELMVLFHDKGLMTLDTALILFGLSKMDDYKEAQPNFRACAFLEALLNDMKRQEHFPDIMSYLLDFYLSWFKQRPQVELLRIPHNHIPKGDGHFASRHDWLDKLPPFAGEHPMPQDCLLRKQRQVSKSNQPTPESSPKFVSSSTTSAEITQKCTCCCCNSILLKLQSLLSSPFLSSPICEKIMEFCGKNYFAGEDSMKLLCYPAIGKTREAVNFVVKHYPSIMLHYAKDVFHNRKEEWKVLLNCLLNTLRENLYEQWNKDTYMEALKGTLLKLARLCEPLEFLTMLPKEGAAGFFIPFVHECYQIHNSISLRKNILQTYEAAIV